MRTNNSFVHLHVRTEFSLLRSMIRVRDLVERAKDFNMPAVAITDYMTLSGAVKFYIEARRVGIKPIIGCEVEVAPTDASDPETESHSLVLLCQNEAGYRNLCKILTRASIGSGQFPGLVTKEMIAKHNECLIALSGWFLDGELPGLLFGREEEAPQAAQWYKDVFGDRLYLELVNGGLPGETMVNKRLIALGKELDIPVVAAGYCAYLDPEDSNAHNVLFYMRSGQAWPDFPKSDPPLATGYYFRSAQEMAEVFADCPNALNNSLVIADRCCFDFNLNEIHLPSFRTSSGKSASDLLREQVTEGFKERRTDFEISDPEFLSREPQYLGQLENEMATILEHDLADYFLIVADYMNWARDNSIPVGPGRGSAAASLVNYCLGITDVNPVAHGLIAERFLNPERTVFPDIDVDVGDVRRNEVISYIIEKYGGPEHVAKILTFGTMKAKAAIRDIGRILKLGQEEIDRIVRLVPPHSYLSEAREEVPELARLIKTDSKYDHLFKIAEKLEGLLRHSSTHAAGVVVSDVSLESLAPVDISGGQESIVHVDMKDVERLGLVRFDILGLKTVTMFGYCLDDLRTKGIELNLSRLPLNDRRAYELLGAGDTDGVFQFESEGSKSVLTRMKPDCFSDLAAVMAQYRPGPLAQGFMDQMIASKHDSAIIDFSVPQLAPILSETYGVWVYQEQVLRVCMDIGGMSIMEADALRMKLVKRLPERSDLEDGFITGAVANGLSTDEAEGLLEEIRAFISFTFNKAHAVAYSLITYRCAFLKANYPDEFRRANERMETHG